MTTVGGGGGEELSLNLSQSRRSLPQLVSQEGVLTTISIPILDNQYFHLRLFPDLIQETIYPPPLFPPPPLCTGEPCET